MPSSVDMLLNQELAAAATVITAEAGGPVEGYLPSSSHVFSHFQQAGTAPTRVLDMGSPDSSIGMSPSTFVMRMGPLPIVDYGDVAVSVKISEVWQQKPFTKNIRAVTLSKGSWTHQEDGLLKRLVDKYGNKRWQEIAKHFPRRIGKQCRERWTNHLHPDLKNDAPWTEEEDMVLIEEHKTLGNRWSKIKKRLSGRSDNCIKNHWNATKRSLNSTRRFGKRFPLLEEYIRSTITADENAGSSSQGSAPPSGLGNGAQAVPSAAAMLVVSSPPGMGTYLHPGNAAGSLSQGATMNMSSALPELNAYGGEMQGRYQYSPSFAPNNNLMHYGPQPAFQQMFSAGDCLQVQDAGANLDMLPLLEVLGLSGSYYGSQTGHTSAAGIGDPDDINVV
ncbi:hypothetical protein ZWY2020_032839 [Hordeum vulgare]|nr:hypothetical protein ZWY2020_032839 [Hordeum vulgare]